MNKIRYYSVVYHSHDSFLPAKNLAHFANKADAINYASGRGPYGGNAEVKETDVVICDSISEAVEYNKELLRRQAMQKLSAEEREALGLT